MTALAVTLGQLGGEPVVITGWGLLTLGALAVMVVRRLIVAPAAWLTVRWRHRGGR